MMMMQINDVIVTTMGALLEDLVALFGVVLVLVSFVSMLLGLILVESNAEMPGKPSMVALNLSAIIILARVVRSINPIDFKLSPASTGKLIGAVFAYAHC